MDIAMQLLLGAILAKGMEECFTNTQEVDANTVRANEVDMEFEFAGINWKLAVTPVSEVTSETKED